MPRVAVVIPAFDEAESVGHVVRDFLQHSVDRVLVVDNGSRDATAETARAAGAIVISEPRRGYGQACLAGLAHLRRDPPEIVVFVDADRSDDPADFPAVVAPIQDGQCEFVIGSRVLGEIAPGSMTPPQRFGNWLAPFLIRLTTGHRFTDLGPFRAIRWAALERLEMADRNYGWTVEMQIKAVLRGVSWVEVPVRYRRRVGRSKISGTVRGVVLAGGKILYTVFREVWRRPTR